MPTSQRRPVRWQIADSLSGKRGRNAILLGGSLLGLLVVGLMLFRPYTARPQLMNDDGVTVKQRRIDCDAAYTSVTRSFNRADPTVSEDVRVCIERGRAKAFTTGIILLFLVAGTLGLSRLPERESKSRGESQWDTALAEARRRQEERGAGRPHTG